MPDDRDCEEYDEIDDEAHEHVRDIHPNICKLENHRETLQDIRDFLPP